MHGVRGDIYPMMAHEAFLDKDGSSSIFLLSVMGSWDVPMERVAFGGFHTVLLGAYHLSRFKADFNTFLQSLDPGCSISLVAAEA